VTLNIPDELMASSLSVSAKLTIAVVMKHPLHTKAEVAKLLNITRSSVHNAIKKAKLEGIDIDTKCIDIDTKCINNATPDLVDKCSDIDTKCSDIDTKCINNATPYLVGSLVGKKEEEAKPNQNPEAKPPTKEEVVAYSEAQGAAHIADEFFDTYSERGWMSKGEPIKNWKAMFRWWAKNKSAVAVKPRQGMSAEDARYAMDAANNL
jgi:hypothetical protein